MPFPVFSLLDISPIRPQNYFFYHGLKWEQREQPEHSAKSEVYNWATSGNGPGTETGAQFSPQNIFPEAMK